MFPEERSLVQEMQGRPFVLLGINNDEELSRAQGSVKKNKLNWRSFFDGKSRRITGLFQIKGYPTVMLIDHKGRIEYPNLRGPKLHAEIKRLVKAAEGDGMEGDKIAAEIRTFRDRSGKHRIEAIAEAKNDDQVKLRKENGETIVMALVDLSRTDQDYLRTVDVPQLGVDAEVEVVAKNAGEFRIFVDSTGKHKIEAVFVKVEDGKVTLRKKDGTTTSLPIDRLSDADKDFVNGLDKGS